MEALADMMDRLLTPEGGVPETGKAVFRQIVAAGIAQLEQVETGHGKAANKSLIQDIFMNQNDQKTVSTRGRRGAAYPRLPSTTSSISFFSPSR